MNYKISKESIKSSILQTSKPKILYRIDSDKSLQHNSWRSDFIIFLHGFVVDACDKAAVLVQSAVYVLVQDLDVTVVYILLFDVLDS